MHMHALCVNPNLFVGRIFPANAAACDAFRLKRTHTSGYSLRSECAHAQTIYCEAPTQGHAATGAAAVPVLLHSRRAQLLAGASIFGLWMSAAAGSQAQEAPLLDLRIIEDLEAQAGSAYATRDFSTAVDLLNQLVQNEPQSARWREMRGQVLVDGKNFKDALTDFEDAIGLTPETDVLDRARLLSGRALAYEGVSNWQAALDDYDMAIELASRGGQSPDPYVLNSRGNAHASLGQWQEARQDYLLSARGFQMAKGFRGKRGSTTLRLDGAVFAASNAAVMLVQLGQDTEAVAEMRKIARRAPGSADMRAALAALYWAQGRETEAESEWEYACNNITVGCARYQDEDWLRRIRRWPPVMIDKMKDFLAVRQHAVLYLLVPFRAL